MKPTANPVDASSIAWVPLRDGMAFRPLQFSDDGYSLQLRVEPGVTVARHRHTGEVHAYNLSGTREILDTGEIVGPGTYVYEPPGNNDRWRCIGDEPCVIQITVKGRLEYLDEEGRITEHTDTHTARETYLAWCRANRVPPHPGLVSG